MSSSEQEFPTPLKIYTSTKDSQGERRYVKLALPAALIAEMERFMRSNTLYLSLHQYMLNCLHYGQQTLAESGMADPSPVFQHAMEASDLLATLEATKRMVDDFGDAWHNAKTPDQRATVSAKIRQVANDTTDPQVAHQLREILG